MMSLKQCTTLLAVFTVLATQSAHGQGNAWPPAYSSQRHGNTFTFNNHTYTISGPRASSVYVRPLDPFIAITPTWRYNDGGMTKPIGNNTPVSLRPSDDVLEGRIGAGGSIFQTNPKNYLFEIYPVMFWYWDITRDGTVPNDGPVPVYIQLKLGHEGYVHAFVIASKGSAFCQSNGLYGGPGLTAFASGSYHQQELGSTSIHDTFSTIIQQLVFKNGIARIVAADWVRVNGSIDSIDYPATGSIGTLTSSVDAVVPYAFYNSNIIKFIVPVPVTDHFIQFAYSSTSGNSGSLWMIPSETGECYLPDSSFPAGQYRFVITGHSSLKKVVNVTVPTVGSVADISLNLLYGDGTHNNVIDVDDLNATLSAYNSVRGDGTYVWDYDYNQDGKIDSDDLAIVLNNYNTAGEN